MSALEIRLLPFPEDSSSDTPWSSSWDRALSMQGL